VLFTEAARKPEAHAAALVVAKALAVVGLRVVRDEKFAKAVSFAFSISPSIRRFGLNENGGTVVWWYPASYLRNPVTQTFIPISNATPFESPVCVND